MVQAGLPVKLLRIKCLETEKVLESPLAMAGLNLLKHRGFSLSLDNFGYDEVQVFFCSRPLLPEGVEHWLNGQSKSAG
jgi:hypothetical protein